MTITTFQWGITLDIKDKKFPISSPKLLSLSSFLVADTDFNCLPNFFNFWNRSSIFWFRKGILFTWVSNVFSKFFNFLGRLKAGDSELSFQCQHSCGSLFVFNLFINSIQSRFKTTVSSFTECSLIFYFLFNEELKVE